MMECVNAMTSADAIVLEDYVNLLILLNPFAPHITEEIYSRLCDSFPSLPRTQLCEHAWPACDEAMLREDTVTLVVQVNGKLRDKLEVPAGISREDAEKMALESPKIKTYTDGNTIRKVIVVPGRLINIVVTPNA